MSSGETFLTATPSVARDIGIAAEWVRNNGSRVLQPFAGSVSDQAQSTPLPCRAYLRQSLYMGNQALAEVCQWDADALAFNLEVVGMNPVPLSRFVLKFSLKNENNPDATPQELFRTDPINVLSTPQQIGTSILTASAGKLSVRDISVSGGNPFYDEDIVIEPADQHPDVIVPEDQRSDTPPATYLGQWHLQFNDVFDGRLVLEAIETNDAFMHGHSQISCQRSWDIPTGRMILVRDVLNFTLPGPARAGSKVCCTFYPDCGFAVTSLGSRQMYLDMEANVQFPDLGT